jgi:hypothetical protein
LQERRCLGILHRLVLCSGVCYVRGLYLRILLPQVLCSGLLHVQGLCPRILYGPGPLLLHGPHRCWGIFHDRCWGILCGLYGLNLCPCTFLGCPSLELPKQGFRCWLTIFQLTLTGGFRGGSNFVAGRRVLCGRRQSLGVRG